LRIRSESSRVSLIIGSLLLSFGCGGGPDVPKVLFRAPCSRGRHDQIGDEYRALGVGIVDHSATDGDGRVTWKKPFGKTLDPPGFKATSCFHTDHTRGFGNFSTGVRQALWREVSLKAPMVGVPSRKMLKKSEQSQPWVACRRSGHTAGAAVRLASHVPWHVPPRPLLLSSTSPLIL
jgi:hypothetical protein